MAKYANKVVAQARNWIGKKESDGSHKVIIDKYNAHKPLARGYKVKYTDSWCATFVSAVAIELGYTDIIPTECGCERMIELFKKSGEWVENDAYTPKAGDVIFYDWSDNSSNYATTDNKAWSDHVGIVESVVNGVITVIEGNYNDKVGRRTLKVDGRYIRGYGVPKYDEEAVVPTYSVREFVKEVQLATGAAVDGIAGTETISKTVTVSATINRKHPVVRAIQKRLNSLGYDCGAVDGIAGKLFTNAVNKYQKNVLKYTKPDGEITKGNKMWKKLLGMI